MEFTQDQRNTKFTQASDTQRYLYSDPDSGEAIFDIAQTNHITPNGQYKSFALAVGDVILGLVPQEQLPQLLMERLEITQPAAMRITADVLDFLEPLNSDSKADSVLTAVSTTENTIPINKEPTVVEPDTLAAELAETEAVFKQLQPIRTMAHDMETIKQVEEPVHLATDQETILNGQGNAQKNESAQWGTPEK
jgi:hypothetical protein